MDGVHDLGGMQGFGPVEREENEPVFHAAWEAAVLAMQRAGGSRGFFNIDEFRHSIERMAPDHYLRATYYEKWLDGVTRVLVEKGVLDAGELAARQAFFAARPDAPATEALRGPLPARPAARAQWAQDVIRDTGATPRFAAGAAVRTREVHPHGHTRLPRYARGKRGVIHRCHGIHVFPDTHAHGQGEQPQPLYSVRFDARELWGESAEPNQAVHIDLWESYLISGS
ncbi:MAG TPA: nitrile hydratase subunit beta [Methylomirabilota bacterium]|jgi:nitrile hydratase beta subunit|nr:nitrile hydratase subunit beta [Methylomirabilota bacterium]